ncbi:hypothetical protein [Myceligenerans pegani]|uniref:Resolvase/invertase-type recombinase catalytic domain-containing protein n=1 Tax=Myceligenerans pegani TaxID=2776917 RepID=A0ABR9MWG8_9MICO|nr:hypothetical protein [Myceligenerans sp. TRM 65318]MBE1875731.1 hypothetical protein [Myceligenerans sp. TRM 65318]MBE3018002.1 hypothetical protein [Myceligenerans sp. TRM 65318]
MNGPRPVVLGYIAAHTDAQAQQQREAVTAYAQAEGFALADVLDDARDGLTISQVTETARHRHADVVVVPGSARLAEAYIRLAFELEKHGVRCTLLGEVRTPRRVRSLSSIRRRQVAQ